MLIYPLGKRLITLFIKLELNILYWFLMTRVGYAFYIYLSCVSIYGHKVVDNAAYYNQIFWLIATYIVFDILSLSMCFFLILRFEVGRQWLYAFVPREYVICCIGNPGGKPLIKSGMVIAGLLGSELLFQVGQGYVNASNAASYVESCKQAGLTPQQETFDRFFAERNDARLGHIFLETPARALKSILSNK